MLVTHWLTHWLPNSVLFSKLDWCDPGMWRWQLKLVEVVTVAHVDDEKRVDNSLVQIWKVKFGLKAKFLFRLGALNRSSIVWLLCMDAASRIKLWSKQLKTAEIRRFERPQLVETCLKVPTFDCEKEESKDLLSVVLSSKDWKDLLQARVGQHWEPTRGKESNHVPAWNCDSQ